MTQVKIFHEHTCKLEDIENKINRFLAENEGKIVVRDIKHTVTNPNPRNHIWQIWDAVLIYDTL